MDATQSAFLGSHAFGVFAGGPPPAVNAPGDEGDESDTEEDCLSHVARHAQQPEAAFFHQLTGAWIQTAYATLPVTRDEVMHLCARWPFAGKGGAV